MADPTPEEVVKKLEDDLKQLEVKNKELKEAEKKRYTERNALLAEKLELEKKRDEGKKLKENEKKINSLKTDINEKLAKMVMPEPLVTQEIPLPPVINPDMVLEEGGVVPPPPPPPLPTQMEKDKPTTKGGLGGITSGAVKLKKRTDVPEKKQEAPVTSLLDQLRNPVTLKKTEAKPKIPEVRNALTEVFKKVIPEEGSARQKLPQKSQTPEEKQAILKRQIEALTKQNKSLETSVPEAIKKIQTDIGIIRRELENLQPPKEYAKHTNPLEVYGKDQEILISRLESNLQELKKLEEQHSQAITQKKQAEENINTKQQEIFEDEVPIPKIPIEEVGQAFVPPPPPEMEIQGELQGPPAPPPPPPPSQQGAPFRPKFVVKKPNKDVPHSTGQTLPKAKDISSKPAAFSVSADEIRNKISQPISEKDSIVKILRNPEHEHYKKIMKALGDEKETLVDLIKDTVDDMFKNDPKLQDDIEYRGKWNVRKRRLDTEGEIKFTAKELNNPQVVMAITKFYDDLSNDQKIKLIETYKKTQPKQKTVAPAKKEEVTAVAKITSAIKTPEGLLEKQETIDLLKKIEAELQVAKKKVEAEQTEATVLTKKASEHLTELERLGPKVIPREKTVLDEIKQPVIADTGIDEKIEKKPMVEIPIQQQEPALKRDTVTGMEEKKEKVLETTDKTEEKIELEKTTTPKTRERADTITSKLPDPDKPYVQPKGETEIVPDYKDVKGYDALPIKFEEETKKKVSFMPSEKQEQEQRKLEQAEKERLEKEKQKPVTPPPKVEEKPTPVLSEQQKKRMRDELNKVNAAAVYMLIEDQYKKSRSLKGGSPFLKLFFPRKDTKKGQLADLQKSIEFIYTKDVIINKKEALQQVFNKLQTDITSKKMRYESALVDTLKNVINQIDESGKILAPPKTEQPKNK